MLNLCALFYLVLSIFSIVTGIIYMTGKRKLNPLELSDKFVKTLNAKEKLLNFTKKMGLVTFIVGLVQGLTAYSIYRADSKVYYYIALTFTIFSVCSVLFKLKSKVNMFPLIKLMCYLIILVTLISPNTRELFLNNHISANYLLINK